MNQSESDPVEKGIYAHRFSPEETATRQVTWRILCRDFLQKFVRLTDTVIDLGAGEGVFLLNIRAARRIALDANPDVEKLRAHGIEVVVADARALSSLFPEQADVIFVSNFLEHLPEKKLVFTILEECRAALKPGGRILILQPNARYVGSAYWDYIDHHIALTEKSVTEALSVSGFEIERVIPRFLPYTVKSRIGHLAKGPWAERLVTLYLRVPLLWKIFGHQTFVVARKPAQTRNGSK